MQKENENLEQPKNQDYFSVEGVATGIMPKTKADEPRCITCNTPQSQQPGKVQHGINYVDCPNCGISII